MSPSQVLGETAGRFPLSSRQQDPHHAARVPEHVVALTFRITGELHVDALRGALEDVVARHESLRTRVVYDEADGSLGVQEVLAPLPVPLPVHDLVVPPGRSRDDIAVDLLNALNDEGLPFDDAPSLRAALHRFDDRDAVLTLITHHLYSDGWSGGILRREIAACYRARVTGVPHELPTPVPYREYAAWEQEFLQSEKGVAARRFWQDNLAGARLLAMPADRPHGPDTLLPRPAVANFSLAPADFDDVVASAARARCSAWHVVLAALMVLADRVSGQSDITLLTINSGRSNGRFHNTVGLFADLVPIRLRSGGCRSVRDLLLAARRASTDAQQHQIPFGEIAGMFPDLLSTVQDPRLVVPGFNYVSSSWAHDEAKSAISFDQVIPPEEPPGYFLRGAFKWNFRVAPPGEFRSIVEYEPDALDASTIDRWGTDFTALVTAIAAEPDRDWKTL
ncbi:condensation domain-containing protein [Amycolatopsis australiensis]|uniref:Condensation domain-containing protein n=1 Tax=Amycolatopsis australiensis TaxID=546364 RepID=A0A1K1RLM5_9PSEU|nr:condensation domain-containing protein [Amycolatopsis australiensis]SFW72606.1 Condensation domain-containing protein [Amycolatopsis australiensis]